MNLLSTTSTEAAETPRKKVPLHENITAILRERIRRGDFEPRSPAPSEAQLRAEFKVSSTTARRSLNDLELEGLIHRVQGKGSFVCERKDETFAPRIGLFFHEVVDLAGYYLGRQVLKGISETLDETGAQPEFFTSRTVSNSLDPSLTLAEEVTRRGIRGLLIISPVPASWLKRTLDMGVPVVSVNIRYDDPRIFCVCPDTAPGYQYVLKRVKEMGHRRMVCFKQVFPEQQEGVTSSTPPPLSNETVKTDFEFLSYSDLERLPHIVDTILAQPEAPTVFFAIGYELASGVLSHLHHRRIAVPDAVSVVAWGDFPANSPFSGVRFASETMGSEAVRIIMSILQGCPPSGRLLQMAPALRVGDTLGPRAAEEPEHDS